MTHLPSLSKLDERVFISKCGAKIRQNLNLSTLKMCIVDYVLTPFQKKYPVDSDDELKIRDCRYDNMPLITIKVQLF